MVRYEVDVSKEGGPVIACSKCQEYNRHGPGSGSKACLKCRRYRDMQRASVRRHTIRIEPVPQIVLEAIPDNRQEGIDAMETLARYLPQLPLRTCFILVASHVSRASDDEIAEELNLSRSRVGQIRRDAYEAIKKARQD